MGTSSSIVGVGTLTIWVSFLRTTLLITGSYLLPTTDYLLTTYYGPGVGGDGHARASGLVPRRDRGAVVSN